MPPVAFLKTHKTGGSTMANILNRLVLSRNLSQVEDNDDGVINWKKLAAKETPHHQYDVICHHQMFNETAVRAFLKPSPIFFTIFREPIAMTDSRFRWKASKNATKYVDSWALRLESMRSSVHNYKNPLARDLGWYDGLDIRRPEYFDDEGDAVFRKDNDTEAISQFISKLDSVLDFAFLTEYYDQGLVLLRRHLGLALRDVSYIKMKESSVSDQAVPPPTLQEKEALKEFLGVDMALYDHFSSRFWSWWEMAGGDAALGAEVAELKERNEALSRDCADPRDEEKCPEEFTWDGKEFRSAFALRDYNALLANGTAPFEAFTKAFGLDDDPSDYV